MWNFFTIKIKKLKIKNYDDRLRLSKVIVKNKMLRFFVVHCVYYIVISVIFLGYRGL